MNLPQNSTLEHYTSYKASELKCTVLALEDLQLNTDGCSLNAIREKYRQEKVINFSAIYLFSYELVKLIMHSSCFRRTWKHFGQVCQNPL